MLVDLVQLIALVESVRMPPQITSIGMPPSSASPMPLAACVRPAAGTIASTPMPPSDARDSPSAMNDAPPSCVTRIGVIDFDALSASYSSVLCTPGMPKV